MVFAANQEEFYDRGGISGSIEAFWRELPEGDQQALMDQASIPPQVRAKLSAHYRLQPATVVPASNLLRALAEIKRLEASWPRLP